MRQLAVAVRPPEPTGGESDNVLQSTFEINTRSPDAIHAKFQIISIPEEERERILFLNLKKNPKFRQSLPSLNAARAFKYGSRSFGQKSWYKENFDINARLKNITDRRKFRFGLKVLLIF